MAQNTTTTNAEDYINKMYDSNLESQKAQLESANAQASADLDTQQEAAKKKADAALARTYVEAQKQQKNYAEVQNAYGLTSGAMAQAKLAQNNQLQSDMATIRAAQQEIDAEIEQQRGLLAQQYAQAIAEAQSNNDLARAQALYEEAKAQETQLLQRQKEAAALMAQAGDYSLYKVLYGLTDEQVATLNGTQLPPPGGEDEDDDGDGEVDPNALAMAGFGNEIAGNVAIGPLENNPMIGYEEPGRDPYLPPTGVAPNSLDSIGYGEFDEDAIAMLVDAGMLEEYVENGVLRWRLGPNNRDENGNAKYDPAQAIVQAIWMAEGGRK